MNRCINSPQNVTAAWLLAMLVMALPAAAAPVVQPDASVAAARSVFVMPSNSQEGRDPFFPNSNRPYESAPASKKGLGDVTSLVLRGISGPPENRLAIINNHTMGVGDEQDLLTPQGRIHIRCVEINSNSVVIESGGDNHILKYNTNP